MRKTDNIHNLLSKAQNYREPNSINFSKCKIATDSSIDGLMIV